MDTSSSPTGNTCFILAEVYESEAGVLQQAAESWEDFGALGAWLGKCQIVGTPSAEIINSLW